MSLRYIRAGGGQCVECKRLSASKYRQNHAKKILEKNRRYRSENAEQVAAYGRKYRQRNAKMIYNLNKSYVAKHRTQVQIYGRRAVAKQLGNHSVLYTKQDVAELREKFDRCCAFCGSNKARRLNCVIPRSQGGSNAIGNLLPACQRCCSSRGAKSLQEWYPAQPFYKVSRWKKILKVLRKTEATLNQNPLF